ncbi:hypothetical protein [Sphaerimonospora mesophila]|uniref:hypothetical protein n=1 Tax=Sphaerimonospora mesophila TaxID=37483 RepID=UPI0006E4664C
MAMPTVIRIVSDDEYRSERHKADSAPRRGKCSWHGEPHEITRSMRLEEHRSNGVRVALYGVCDAARAEITDHAMRGPSLLLTTVTTLSVGAD